MSNAPEQLLLDYLDGALQRPLAAATVAAAKVFISDTLAVGLAGSRHPRVAQVKAAVAEFDTGAGCSRAWNGDTLVSAPAAAFINAWQVHNQEFDCVHEAAVVHPLAAVLPSLLAHAEAQSRSGRPVSGAHLIAAVAAATDVAITVALAQRAPMRFFRPAMCGGLGATAGLGLLAGLPRAAMGHALGLAYSQLAGTMQAHTEGSPSLPLHISWNARAAFTALALARAGVPGPRDWLTGAYGYYALFDEPLHDALRETLGNESASARLAVFGALGQCARIGELSHKPLPTGRAAHGLLDGLGQLLRAHRFAPAEIRAARLYGPPLIVRLVGRPAVAGMDENYAKLCAPWLGAVFLHNGDIRLQDFERAMLDDPAHLALAQRISVLNNGATDPNALTPQRVEVDLASGRTVQVELPDVLGHPRCALSPAAQRIKFDACLAAAEPPLPPARSAALFAAVMQLDQLADVRQLTGLLGAQAA